MHSLKKLLFWMEPMTSRTAFWVNIYSKIDLIISTCITNHNSQNCHELVYFKMQWSFSFVWNFRYLHINCMGHLIFFTTALCVTVCNRYFIHRNYTPKDIWTQLKICIKLSRIVLFLDDQHAILSLKTLQSKNAAVFLLLLAIRKTDNSHEISCLKNLNTSENQEDITKFVVCCSQGLTLCLPAMNFVICW